MKVAVIIDTWFPAIGGGQINASEISKRIARKGHKVNIITRNSGPYTKEKIKNLGIIKLGKKSNPDDNISRVFFLIRAFLFVKSQSYDIVHLQAFLPGLLSPFIKTLLKKPTIFTVHGTRMFENGPKASFGSWLEKIILTKIKYDSQISVTKTFLKFKNVNKNISYIPNGIDLRRFYKVQIPKAKYPKILWVGRFDPVKKLEDLLSAMKILQKQLPNAKLTIVGYGRDERKLKQFTKTLKLSNVEFVGNKEGVDLIKEYKSSHVFVLCSSSEGQPLTILEAQSFSLPVVATAVGGIPEIITNNKDGILVTPKRPLELAEALIQAIKKGNKFSYEAGQKQKFRRNWDDVASETLKVYQSLC